MTTPLIHARGLKKAYQMGERKLNVLDGVDISVNSGDSVAVMGPSGSGKSTLMHLLGCLDRPSEGNYWLMDKNTAEMDDVTLAKMRGHHIGFVFQAFNLIPQLTVLENVILPFMYRSYPQDIENKAIDILNRIGLGSRINHPSNSLSGGEMQRVAIARALVIEPSVILADEPTGNLDATTGQSILNLMQELAKQGVAIIIVTHDLHVAQHCERIIRMKDGKIIDGY